MDIGNKLKELRIAKGLTQEELADRSELSKSFISQVERNLYHGTLAFFRMKNGFVRNIPGTSEII